MSSAEHSSRLPCYGTAPIIGRQRLFPAVQSLATTASGERLDNDPQSGSHAAQLDMTLDVITCESCGHEARPGLRYCPACARPLRASASGDPAAPQPDQNLYAQFGFTDSWDSVAPRLQAALYGEFVISRELGRGGMAAVFLAHQLKLNRKVAIKVMAPTLMSGMGLVDRFRDEATTVARLEHPNIISIFEVGEATGLQYFIMQFVPGRSLERAMRQYGQMPFEVTRAIIFEIGSALAYAHRHQVIHRDVKPGNILLSLDGRILVTDFGIAKVVESTARTQTGAIIGTPAYMSPEQCLGRQLTWAADQYSLGVLAFEIVSGVQPFTGTPYTVMRGHIEEPIPDLRHFRPDCPPDIAAGIGRMLAKRPADRFASMSEALAAVGATRASVTEAIQEAIGRFAVPLPAEEGSVLVHTPASPVPSQGARSPTDASAPSASQADAVRPPGSNGWPVLAAIQARLGRVTAGVVGGVGGAMTRISPLARLALAQARSAARAVGTRVAATPMGMRSIVGAGAVVLAIAALVIAIITSSGPPTERNIAALAPPDTARGLVGPQPIPDSTAGIISDSLTGPALVDSVLVSVDSAALRELTIHVVGGSRRVSVGDTVRLEARILNYGRQRVRGISVEWSVPRVDVATIDSVSGVLYARRVGTVTVTAKADTFVRQLRLTVVAPRVAPTTVSADPRPDEIAEKPSDAGEEEAEKESVEIAVNRFISEVLDGRDTTRINALYRSRTPDDSAGRVTLLTSYRDKSNLRIRPPQRPQRLVLEGRRARAEARIGLQWRGRLRSAGSSMVLYAELERAASGWQVIGFRLGPA